MPAVVEIDDDEPAAAPSKPAKRLKMQHESGGMRDLLRAAATKKRSSSSSASESSQESSSARKQKEFRKEHRGKSTLNATKFDAAPTKAAAPTGDMRPTAASRDTRASRDAGQQLPPEKGGANRPERFDSPPRAGTWEPAHKTMMIEKPNRELDPEFDASGSGATQPAWMRQEAAAARIVALEQKAEKRRRDKLIKERAEATAKAEALEKVHRDHLEKTSQPFSFQVDANDDDAWDALDAALGTDSPKKPKERASKPDDAKQPTTDETVDAQTSSAAAEPINDGELRPGSKVVLHGLVNAAHLNDQVGVLEEFIKGTERWRVNLSGLRKDLKAENLAPINQKRRDESLLPGGEVRLHGLPNGSDHLNGECGLLEAYNEKTGRWRVKLEDGEMKDIDQDNIQKNELQQYMLKKQQNVERNAYLEEEDDEGPHFVASAGDSCGPMSRFIIQEKIGKGVFATVYRCKDKEVRGVEYAIKFTRNNEMMKKNAEREISLMGQLCNKASEHDPEGARCLLSLIFFEGFDHKGHLAVVSELMKCNLATAQSKYMKGKGFPLLPSVRNFGRNLFLALRVLKLAGLIHCDIKPENLLLSRDGLSIKLADFGSAMTVSEYIRSDVLQPRFYRSPEVMLGQRYGRAIDVWSTGAVLFELATGKIMFEEEKNNLMLHAFLKVCGPMTKKFTTSGRFAPLHFNAAGDFLNSKGDVSLNSDNPRTIPMMSFSPTVKPIQVLIGDTLKEPTKGIPLSRHEGLVRLFIDLLQQCLIADPADRADTDSALEHAFFQPGAGTSTTEPEATKAQVIVKAAECKPVSTVAPAAATTKGETSTKSRAASEPTKVEPPAAVKPESASTEPTEFFL